MAMFFLCILLFSWISIIEIHAETKVGYITANDLPFTKKPNIESPKYSDYVAPGLLHWLDIGDEVETTGEKVPSTVNSCKTEFYQVKHNFVGGGTYTGYICGDYLKFEIDITPYIEEFKAAGFPDSYWKYLANLKEQHPNWTFQALQTGIEWEDAINNEAIVGKSLIHKNNSGNGGYLDLSPLSYDYMTDTWKYFDGTAWYAANRETVAYYLDPRNFLSEMYVFMFEDLSYQKELQTKELVSGVLGSDFLRQYIDSFMQAAENYNISPIHLASRVRQEVGTSASVTTNGAPFEKDGKTYSSLYNFYNIGATSGVDNWKNGLVWANGGANQTATTYGRPWNTPEKSILGGAEFLANRYVKSGQNTIYFQKWNVATDTPFTNQYMTNIMAPMSEASTIFSSYEKSGLMKQKEESMPFAFIIPVYKNMPQEKVSLPAVGNPNNYLKTLTVNGNPIDQFNSSNTSYIVYVNGSSVELSASAIHSGAQIAGLGIYTLTEKETKIPVIVTAQNGSKKQYDVTVINTTYGQTDDVVKISIPEVISQADFRIEEQYLSKLAFNQTVANVKERIQKINKELQVTVTDSNGSTKKDDQIIGTGDQIQFSIHDQSETYQAILYGDVNSDGKLDLTDILAIQKHYIKLNGFQLSGAYYKAGNVDRNGTIDLNDLLQFQRQYINLGTIQQ